MLQVGKEYRVKTLEQLKSCGTDRISLITSPDGSPVFSVGSMSKYCGSILVYNGSKSSSDHPICEILDSAAGIHWVFPEWMLEPVCSKKAKLLNLLSTMELL